MSGRLQKDSIVSKEGTKIYDKMGLTAYKICIVNVIEVPVAKI